MWGISIIGRGTESVWGVYIIAFRFRLQGECGSMYVNCKGHCMDYF